MHITNKLHNYFKTTEIDYSNKGFAAAPLRANERGKRMKNPKLLLVALVISIFP
jgi:hypothetical protein